MMGQHVASAMNTCEYWSVLVQIFMSDLCVVMSLLVWPDEQKILA